MKITYDDSKLEKFFADLDPKQRKSALKGCMRRSAGKVRKQAVSNLRSCTTRKGTAINSNRELERGIRAIVYKKKAVGFRVTVGPGRGGRGYYKTKGYKKAYDKAFKKSGDEKKAHEAAKGKMKPVLIWMENGTKARSTRSWPRSRRHSTGTLRSYGFIKKTEDQMKGRITEVVRDSIREYMTKLIKKYGG